MTYTKNTPCITMALSAVILLTLATLAASINQEEPEMGTVIGIDLGTTYTSVAISHDGQTAELIPNDFGNREMPSYVAFTPFHDVFVGEAAKNRLVFEPQYTIYDIKRIIGREWLDPVVQDEIKRMPFKVVECEGNPCVEVEMNGKNRNFLPEGLSSKIITKMKLVAQAFIGEKITHAVVSVPANFDSLQKQATMDAAEKSGLKVVRLITEPTAAAIAYGMDKVKGVYKKTILVYDLGGGTLDVSVLRLNMGAFEVLATSGNMHLGGEDFDQRVVEDVIKTYEKKGWDIRGNPSAFQKIRLAVEKVKWRLSNDYSAKLDIYSVLEGRDISETITRAKFEHLNADLFKATLKPVEDAIHRADLVKSQIDDVILVGGSSNIPKIHEIITEFFDGKKPSASTINPKEAVAYGAAIQAAVLSGKEKLDIVERTPLSIGRDIVGGRYSIIIKRGTVIPTESTRTYHTVDDDQDSAHVNIYEGERVMAALNHKLGEVTLNNIRKRLAKQTKTDVTFAVDANGLLHVTARERGTDNVQKLDIKNGENRLPPQKIMEMFEQARLKADEEKDLNEREDIWSDLHNKVCDFRISLHEGLSSKVDQTEAKSFRNFLNEKLTWLNANPKTQPVGIVKRHQNELEEHPFYKRYKDEL